MKKQLFALAAAATLIPSMRAADIAPLTVSIDRAAYETEASYTVGDALTIDAVIEGGQKPYTCEWTDRRGATLGSDESLSLTIARPDRFTLSVTSADGQTASTYVLISAYGCTDAADFEDHDLAPESVWRGYTDRDGEVYPWYSGGFSPVISYWAAYNSISGFMLTNSTTHNGADYTQDYDLAAGAAHSGSGYAVAYCYAPYDIHVLADRDGARLGSVYVTNTAYAYGSITKGDSFSKPFEKGNFLKAVFTGDDPAGSPVEVYLADYRGDTPKVLTGWERVDLSPLGKVRKLSVAVSGHSDMVPTYVALDDLTYAASDGIGDVTADGERPVQSVRYFTPDGREAAAAALAPGIYVELTTYTDGTTAAVTRAVR